MIDCRIDGAMLPSGWAQMGQSVSWVIPWPTVTLHKVHSAVPAPLRDRYAFASLNIIIILALLPSTTSKCGGLQSSAN